MLEKLFNGLKVVGERLDPYTSRKFLVVVIFSLLVVLDGLKYIDLPQENLNNLLFVVLGYIGGNVLDKKVN